MRAWSPLALTLTMAVLVGCGKASSGQANTARSIESQSDFDRGAALSVLSAAGKQAQSCEKAKGPHGSFRIAVHYRNDGNVGSVELEPPMAGGSDDANRVVTAEVQNCVEDVFRKAAIPPYVGSEITVRKMVIIP